MKLVMEIDLLWIQQLVKTTIVPYKPVLPTATATYSTENAVKKVGNSWSIYLNLKDIFIIVKGFWSAL